EMSDEELLAEVRDEGRDPSEVACGVRRVLLNAIQDTRQRSPRGAEKGKRPRYSGGELVRRVSNPDVVGQVVEALWDDQAEEWTYRVRFGSGLRGVPEAELEALPEESDPWSELQQGRVAGAAAFKSLLTYERLRKPPSRLV